MAFTFVLQPIEVAADLKVQISRRDGREDTAKGDEKVTDGRERTDGNPSHIRSLRVSAHPEEDSECFIRADAVVDVVVAVVGGGCHFVAKFE